MAFRASRGLIEGGLIKESRRLAGGLFHVKQNTNGSSLGPRHPAGGPGGRGMARPSRSRTRFARSAAISGGAPHGGGCGCRSSGIPHRARAPTGAAPDRDLRAICPSKEVKLLGGSGQFLGGCGVSQCRAVTRSRGDDDRQFQNPGGFRQSHDIVLQFQPPQTCRQLSQRMLLAVSLGRMS
jgi:hypothetical protein